MIPEYNLGTYAVFTAKLLVWQGFIVDLEGGCFTFVRPPRRVLRLVHNPKEQLSGALLRVTRATEWRKRSLMLKRRIAIPAIPGTKAARRITEQTSKREANLLSYAAS